MPNQRDTRVMATAPALRLIPASEHLHSPCPPDVEYIDGTPAERSVSAYLHSLLQAILITYFRQFERNCKFKVLSRLRTQIMEGGEHHVPDLLLCAVPTKIDQIMTETPLAVIEILSPADRVRELLQRFHDYATLGGCTHHPDGP